MSDKTRAWCWDHSPFSGSKFIVHFAMADMANDTNDFRLWMTDSALAKKARTTTKTVQRTKAELVELGMLEILSPPAPKRPSEYRFMMPVHGGQDVHRSTVVAPEPTVVDGGHLVLDGGQDVSRTVDISSSAPITNQRVTKENQSALELKKNPLLGFDQFWEVYPRRNGKRLNRGVAEKVWVKLSLEDRRAAYRGAVIYARAVAAEQQIAKDPDRWLKHRLWTDWQDPPEGGTLVPNGGRPSGPRDPMRRGGSRLQELAQAAHDQDQGGRQMALVR